MKLTKLLDKISEYGVYPYTCSADNPENHCITYATSEKYLNKIEESKKDIIILVARDETYRIGDPIEGSFESKIIRVDNVKKTFILLHNYLNRFEDPERHDIYPMARIHPKAHIGADGMRYIREGDALINMKHMGNVVVKDYTEIGPFSTVARATLDSTIIEDHARIGHGVYIGHNCRVGERTVIVDGAIMGGSSEVGNDCWLGLNCTVRNGVKICDNVFIAMGALVSKNIDKPGMYVGSPAKRIGGWDGSW